jgi:hypothetical protein
VILSLCLGGVACLTPLALYLFWLGFVNRRDRVTVVSGTWDFVALLAGLSGFIVCGSGLFLTAVVARSRLWGGHTFEEIRTSWGRDQTAWVIALGVYLVVLGLVIGLSLRNRRRTLAAYNCDLAAAETALASVFGELGIVAKRFGNLWSDADGRVVVEVLPFHQLRHVSFILSDTGPRMCEELDRRLRAALPARVAAENPLSQWVSTAAVSSFVIVLCCVVLIGAAVFFPK